MTFDADAYLASEAPPTFTVGGRTYTGRHLSAEEQFRHLGALAALDDPATTDEAARAVVESFVSALFPEPIGPAAPRRHWWPWHREVPRLTVLDLFRALPLGAQLQAVRGFALVLASTMAPTSGPTTMPGARSVDATTTTGNATRSPTSRSSSPASSRASALPPTTIPGATAPGTA